MAAAQGRDLDVLRASGHPESHESAATDTTNCVTLAARRQKGLSVRVAGINLDAEGWVKNVLVPVLVDEFIKENGDPR
jgi:hypothetical protein